MLTTLKAAVLGNRIEWLEASERVFPPDRQVKALITPLDEPTSAASAEERAARRLAALKKLAAAGAFAGVSDPIGWQREARSDRELPGRDAD